MLSRASVHSRPLVRQVGLRAAMCVEIKTMQFSSRSRDGQPNFKEPSSIYTHGKFRSDAAEQIKKVPVIFVNGNTAICDGGSGVLGHPIEYIQLNTVSDEPQNCKYCGLRYKKAPGSHHH